MWQVEVGGLGGGLDAQSGKSGGKSRGCVEGLLPALAWEWGRLGEGEEVN